MNIYLRRILLAIIVLSLIVAVGCKDGNGNVNSAIDVGPDGDTDGDTDGDGTNEWCDSLSLPAVCTSDWYSDGECDPSNNRAECSWDGGDCCESTCNVDGCGDYVFDCLDPAAGGSGVAEPELIGDPCAEVPDPFAPDHLEAEVTLLASDELAGRLPGTTADLTVRKYIEKRFRCLELSEVNTCYQQAFLNEDGDPTANVIGMIEGGDPAVADQIIVVGAHHDHLGVEDGEIYNGANDNASGVVSLMAIADQAKRRATPPRRTVVFIAFGSEESGLEGSYHYVANPPSGLPMNQVVYMINLDMVATYPNDNLVYAFGSFPGTPARDVLDALLANNPPELTVELGASAVAVEGEEDSDYAGFCNSGVPYLYFFTEDDRCLHLPCDDAANLDYVHMGEITRLATEVLLALADSEVDLVAAREALGCGEN